MTKVYSCVELVKEFNNFITGNLRQLQMVVCLQSLLISLFVGRGGLRKEMRLERET